MSGLIYPIRRVAFFGWRGESYCEGCLVEELAATQRTSSLVSFAWGYDPLTDTFPTKYMLAWKSGGHLGRLRAYVRLEADMADALVFWETRRGDERELAEEFEGSGRGGRPESAGVEVRYCSKGCLG